MPKIYKISNCVKIIKTVLEIYETYVHRQTDNLDFYMVEIYLDRLLVPEMYIVPNFAKIVRAVLEIYRNCVHGQEDRQPDFLQG